MTHLEVLIHLQANASENSRHAPPTFKVTPAIIKREPNISYPVINKREPTKRAAANPDLALIKGKDVMVTN